MGRIVTPKYRVEVRGNWNRMGKALTPQAWSGRVSEKRLEEYRQAMNRSFNKGGSNFHLAKSDGFIYHMSSARIVRQSDGVVMCEVQMPAFEVV